MPICLCISAFYSTFAKNIDMKIDIIDMNLPEWKEWWESNRPSNDVYRWDFPVMYRRYYYNADAYIFMWDDGKGKHESFEIELFVPINEPYGEINETFYGYNKIEAMAQLLEWLRGYSEIISKLNTEVCGILSDSQEK